MRDRIERLVLLPFAVGCMSESSVAVANQNNQQSKNGGSPPLRTDQETTDRDQEEEGSLPDESANGSFSLMALSKPNISTGIHRLFKGFRSFSHLFDKEEDMEGEEMEIEIGLPTDVKHVTHIGWDGCAALDPIKGWDRLVPPDHEPLHSPDQHDLLFPSSADACLAQPEHSRSTA
ncbi:CRIB domain-containing protein RIC4 isoform X2 [Rhodamnia argentea]|uniref:CRIB domain-containing protein RIC4 isoform X2 n=1 Tax=Rhodamnia argentea TaxID=178133 RepID=A0A8B8P3J4_9MYRT|nr:CRIB domain-containing protein RIC4 isoform X2 [Rhodamnia argentea]